ncbi:MAG: hypothetical protein LBU60_01180 [Clostridiales bacterium]|nr:hypothetical protein [Clostridiales bacterium]
MFRHNRFDTNRSHRPVPPIASIPPACRPPHICHSFVLAAFATRRSADIFFRRLLVAGIHATIEPFNRRQFFGNNFAVRMRLKDKFFASRLLFGEVSADFLGWFHV